MSAAAAGLSRVAAGAGAAPVAAGAGGVQRGVRAAVTAVTTAGSSNMSTALSSQQQQQHLHHHHHYHHHQQQQQPFSMQFMAAPQRQWRAPRRHHQPPQAAVTGAAALASAMGGPHYVGSGTPRRPPGQFVQQRLYASAQAAQLAAQEGEEEAAVAAGSLLEFERGKEYLLGRAVKKMGQGWQVETASGTLYSVRAADIKYVLPGGAARSAADLAAVEAAATAELARDEGLLLLAWEVAAPSGEGTAPIFTVPEMADFLFSRSDPTSCATALRLLRNDRLYFRQVGRNPPMFSPRTASQVESLQTSLRLQQEAEAEWAGFLAEVQRAQRQPRSSKPGEVAWRAGPHAARLAAVEGLAVGTLPLSGPERSLAAKTLVDLGKTPSTQEAAELLQSVGWWPPHLQLGLLTAGISDIFSAELEAVAQALLGSPPSDPDAACRRDFTSAAHAVLTIDDASTTEIDDGLSLERFTDGGFKVWVHIADPSRWVAPGSPLAVEARRRTKSLYLPTGMVPMFPKCLAEGPFSLRQGAATEAVSVGVQVSPEGALVPGSLEVVPSRVCPARRLTYEDVDELLYVCEEQDEQDLFDLRRVAELRRAYRLSRGAIEICMPESSVRVDQPHLEEPDVDISEEDQYLSPARQMVAEMMILAGEAVGELGRQLGVPLPYRGQADPVLPEAAEMEAVPPGPCRAILLRGRMTRSVTTTHAPLRHAGLGLDAYVQFTSPIRRYGDLLAHWQLKAVLRGEQAPWEADPFMVAVEEMGATTQRVTKLEREVEAYWVAEYFRQAAKRSPRSLWEALFLCWLKQEAGLARVLLGGLGLEAVLRINSPVEPGELLYVRCSHTDVQQGMYRLEVVPRGQVDARWVVNQGCNEHSGYSALEHRAY